MVKRRKLLIAGIAIAAGAIAVSHGPNLFYAAIAEEASGVSLTVEEAHARAKSGEITLIDIRRPDEWDKTGSGEGAIRLDMRRPDFVDELAKITGGNRNAPVALICARGVRSAHMTNVLTEAGFTSIIDVPEGMLGSGAGAGWLRKGLPVVK